MDVEKSGSIRDRFSGKAAMPTYYKQFILTWEKLKITQLTLNIKKLIPQFPSNNTLRHKSLRKVNLLLARGMGPERIQSSLTDMKILLN